MKFTKQERLAILDALIFTLAGDACYDNVDRESMKSAIKTLAKGYPDHIPQVYLHSGGQSEERLYDDEENSKYVEETVKTIKITY